jgi:hypothetical protein
MHRFQRFYNFLNGSWKLRSVRVFSTACDSASTISIVSKWRPFSFISNRENRKIGCVGDSSHVVLGKKNSLVKEEVWDGALSWYNSQFFHRQSSGRNLSTFPRNRRKTSQYYEELTVWPAGTNSLRCQRKWWACSLPRTLSNHCQGYRRTFSQMCTKYDDFPLSYSSRNRIRLDTWLQIKGRKRSALPPSSVKCCTPSPKIC